PGSLSFEVQDVPAIAAAAHATGAVVVADSTWATPLGWPSFALGVDVSIHAATKYIVGHSDVMMGVTLCTEALAPTLRRSHRELGLMVSSDDAYLALRGLRTLAARLAQHKTNTAHLVQWLQQQPEVERLLYPPNPDDAGHALWRRDFHTDYACGLLGVLFRADIRPEQVEALTNAASLFGIGFSWGGYESLILPTQPGKMRTVSERWRDRQLLRLHIGLEAPADLQASLDEGFAALRSV
uniref:PLP-dependent transferase n=1 Tax=Chitinimonas sp. TaxID=1934313 RepID=UPI0035AF95B0